MGYMFGDCRGLASLDLSGLDTGSVTDMHNMFYGCSGLASLDLSGLDTGRVTNMGYMFGYCRGLASLDLSGLHTGRVTNMGGMFQGCSKLTSLDLSGLDTGSVTNMGGMFDGCSSLTTVTYPSDSNSKAKLKEALKNSGINLYSSQRAIAEDANALSASSSMESHQLVEGLENRNLEPAGSESLSSPGASACTIGPSSNVSDAGQAEADSPSQSGGSESIGPSAEKADDRQPNPDGSLSSGKSGSSAQEK